MLSHYHKESNEITSYWRLPPGTNFKQVLDKAEFFDDSVGAYCSINQNKKDRKSVVEGKIVYIGGGRMI